MSNGILTISAGMRAQAEALDVMANNLANLNSPGFKGQVPFLSIFEESLQAQGTGSKGSGESGRLPRLASALNMQEGSLAKTQRDLDIAIAGEGFLVVRTPQGERYTRNGNLSLNSRSELSDAQGMPLVGQDGPIVIGPGQVRIDESGEVHVNSTRAGRLKIVTFDKPSALRQEGHALLAPADPSVAPKVAKASVRQGFLEQSNVNAVGSMVEMVAIMRRFEALQRSLDSLRNNLDSKSIEKLGR